MTWSDLFFISGQKDFSEEEVELKLEEWSTAKQFVNNELVKWITDYDPTAGNAAATLEMKLSQYLSGIIAT